MPYADTPNNGGEYKAWATPVGNFLCPLTSIDCSSGKHGFVDAFSKTINPARWATTARHAEERVKRVASRVSSGGS
jgi:hypothetical protein